MFIEYRAILVSGENEFLLLRSECAFLLAVFKISLIEINRYTDIAATNKNQTRDKLALNLIKLSAIIYSMLYKKD